MGALLTAAPEARPAEGSRAAKNRNTPEMGRVLERPDGNRYRAHASPLQRQATRRSGRMTPDVGGERLDQAFRRARELEALLGEQLRAFADAAPRQRPEFAAAVDRLVEHLRQYGAGESAPQPGEPMPPFALPGDAGHLVGLDQLLGDGPVAVTFHRGH